MAVTSLTVTEHWSPLKAATLPVTPFPVLLVLPLTLLCGGLSSIARRYWNGTKKFWPFTPDITMVCRGVHIEEENQVCIRLLVVSRHRGQPGYEVEGIIPGCTFGRLCDAWDYDVKLTDSAVTVPR